MGVKARRDACVGRLLPVGLQFGKSEVVRSGVLGCLGLQGYYRPTLYRLFRCVPQVLLIRAPLEVSPSHPRPRWPSVGHGIGSAELRQSRSQRAQLIPR